MLPCAAVREAPFEPLYDAVALGMWAYTRSAFRVQTLGTFEPRPGLVLVCAHRAETDVPLICPSFYFRAGYLTNRTAERIHFVARDDMFARGFFAGFPNGLSPPVRRLLYPLAAGRVLPKVRVHPVPYPSTALLRLGSALESVPPNTRLEDVLPERLSERLTERARSLGHGAPTVAAEVLDGAYADLLWEYWSRSELRSPLLQHAWQRRRAEGAGAVRRLVELLRAGRMLLIFPEGRPSPDGTLTPFQAGLSTLVRLGRPVALQPVGVAYDRLTTGRARAIVSFGPPVEPAAGDLDESTRAALARAMPVTCGSVVAAELARLAQEGRGVSKVADLEAALAGAAKDGRPCDGGLTDLRGRRARLGECLDRLFRDALIEHRGRGELVLVRERILANEAVLQAARERESILALA